VLITVNDYFGPRWGNALVTPEVVARATLLLEKVDPLLRFCKLHMDLHQNPRTKTYVSGWSGDGGWRLPDSETGVAKSKHKIAAAVDVYDPQNEIDDFLTDEILAEFGLYREHPLRTNTWCHLQDIAPGSRKRTFWP